jgi:hypothetical protein
MRVVSNNAEIAAAASGSNVYLTLSERAIKQAMKLL